MQSTALRYCRPEVTVLISAIFTPSDSHTETRYSVTLRYSLVAVITWEATHRTLK